MTDKKISALTGATTPLAGTEVLPIVQGVATVKVAVSDLTAGRLVWSTGLNTLDTLGIAVQKIFGSGAGYAGNVGAYSYGTLTLYDNDGATVLNCQTPLAGAGVKLQTGGITRLWAKDTGNVDFTTGNLVQGTAAKGVNFTANTPAAGMTSQLLNWYEEGTWTPVDQSGASLVFTGIAATYTKVGRQVICNASFSYPVTASAAAAVIGGLPFNSGSYGPASIQGFFSATTATIVSRGLYGGANLSRVSIDKNNATATASNLDMSGALIYFTIVYQV